MNDQRDSSSPDPLDDWLATARWPEATPMSMTRLRATWRELARPQRRSQVRTAIAIAASILIVLAFWVILSSRPSRGPAITLNPFEQPAEAASVRLPGREMTGLEKTLVEAQIRNEERRKKLSVAPLDAASERSEGADGRASKSGSSGSSLRSDTGVAPAVVRGRVPIFAVRPFLERVVDTSTRSEALAELDHLKSPPIEQLLAFLSDSRADLRVAAALALGRIDGPVLTRRLIAMIEQNQNRREAFIALASSRGREARLFVRGAAASEQYAGIARSAMIASQSELQ